MLRRVLVPASLVLLGVAELSTLRVLEVRQRVSRAVAFETVPVDRDDPAGFWFDPAYAQFVAAVKRATPENATVAILGPAVPDLYFYRAVYGLVPRRVVGRRNASDARFVAIYGSEPVPGLSAGEALPGGRLVRR